MSWDKLHQHYNQQDWGKIPSIFATEAVHFFPTSGRLLELGAGIGQDSRYFHSLGYHVDSTDFSLTAGEMNEQYNPGENYRTFVLDATSDLGSLSDGSYDIVYAHLSLHYFPLDMTQHILGEISRILASHGVLAVLLNTTRDPEYGTGNQIEPDFFQIPGKTQKRYFSQESAKELFGTHFDTIICDDAGETYKDSEKGIHNLIRYIGHKI